jgi:hypothetical protein
MVGGAMNVSIVIHYISNDNKIMRRGSYPLKGKKKELVALEFWKWIKRDMPFECEIETIICDGEDYTERVKKLDVASLD